MRRRFSLFMSAVLLLSTSAVSQSEPTSILDQDVGSGNYESRYQSFSRVLKIYGNTKRVSTSSASLEEVFSGTTRATAGFFVDAQSSKPEFKEPTFCMQDSKVKTPSFCKLDPFIEKIKDGKQYTKEALTEWLQPQCAQATQPTAYTKAAPGAQCIPEAAERLKTMVAAQVFDFHLVKKSSPTFAGLYGSGKEPWATSDYLNDDYSQNAALFTGKTKEISELVASIRSSTPPSHVTLKPAQLKANFKGFDLGFRLAKQAVFVERSLESLVPGMKRVAEACEDDYYRSLRFNDGLNTKDNVIQVIRAGMVLEAAAKKINSNVDVYATSMNQLLREFVSSKVITEKELTRYTPSSKEFVDLTAAVIEFTLALDEISYQCRRVNRKTGEKVADPCQPQQQQQNGQQQAQGNAPQNGAQNAAQGPNQQGGTQQGGPCQVPQQKAEEKKPEEKKPEAKNDNENKPTANNENPTVNNPYEKEEEYQFKMPEKKELADPVAPERKDMEIPEDVADNSTSGTTSGVTGGTSGTGSTGESTTGSNSEKSTGGSADPVIQAQSTSGEDQTVEEEHPVPKGPGALKKFPDPPQSIAGVSASGVSGLNSNLASSNDGRSVNALKPGEQKEDVPGIVAANVPLGSYTNAGSATSGVAPNLYGHEATAAARKQSSSSSGEREVANDECDVVRHPYCNGPKGTPFDVHACFFVKQLPSCTVFYGQYL